MTKKDSKRYEAGIYRLVISYLSVKKFGVFPVLGKNVKREPNLSPNLEALKSQILELILLNQKHRGLTNYTIAWETHQSNGLAHLDILLKYDKRIKKRLSSFNYLLNICPQDLGYFSQKQGQVPQVNITPYNLTRLNQAVLDYSQKEDPDPLSNFSYQQSRYYLYLSQIKKDPFAYFHQEMKKDPYNFDLAYYAQKYNLMKQISGWSAIKSKLTDSQSAARALLQHSKSGIKQITQELINQKLTPEEKRTFYHYPCFKTIIDHINQIPKYGSHRPHKTLNLYIWGPKGIGKSSFINEGHTNLSQMVPHYDIRIQNKYLNRYYNNVYGFISWNQFKYTDFSPNWILLLLEGANLQIPIRYSSNVKRDNPLIIATSNISLKQHIQRRFKDQPKLISLAKSNLINERITEVYVPVHMFFLQKLLVPADPPTTPS